MSIDHSLKVKGALSRHRNVLTRAERIAKLREEDRWNDGDSVLQLAKVANRKSHSGRKEKAAEKAAEVKAAEAQVETPAKEGV